MSVSPPTPLHARPRRAAPVGKHSTSSSASSSSWGRGRSCCASARPARQRRTPQGPHRRTTRPRSPTRSTRFLPRLRRKEPLPDSGPQRQRTAFDPCTLRTCSGTTTPELEQAIAYRAKTAHRCYDQALANDSDLKGHVTIKVKIASNGNMCAANVSGNDMGADVVANCVANTFRAARNLPPPKGQCVEVQVPIAFIPGGK